MCVCMCMCMCLKKDSEIGLLNTTQGVHTHTRYCYYHLKQENDEVQELE